MVSKKLLFVFALTVSLCSSTLAPVLACGPFTSEANFSYILNPDFPLKKFAAGRVGVIEPSFAKTYLFSAYRYMNGKPLFASEQQAMMALLINRLDHSGHRNNLNASPVPLPANDVSADDADLAAWKNEHNKVPGIKPLKELETSRKTTEDSDNFSESYLNCSGDAFSYANTTLQTKIAKHGLDSPFVKNWVTSQDKVFCHCGGNEYDFKTKKYAKEPGFPELSPQDTDTESKFDRHYQIASAHFYAQKFDEAFKEFGAIADDASSPYAAVSRYMTARCLMRKANLFKLDQATKNNTFESALRILNDVCANNSTPYQTFHLPAQRLISMINCTIHPDKQMNALGKKLASSGDDKNFQQDLDDYTTLVHRAEGYTEDDNFDLSQAKTSFPKTAADDDLTYWITTLQLGSADKSFKTAEAQFEKTHSTAWLFAALTFAAGDKTKNASLIAAAKALASTSPGYLSVNYALAKLLVEMHDTAAANELIAKLETTAKNEQVPSSLNLIMDLRAKLPMNANEFVVNSVRVPASYSYDLDYFDSETQPVQGAAKASAPAFAFANANFINKSVPLSFMANICGDSKLPSALKLDLAQATFVRAILLDDADAFKKSSDVLTQLSVTDAKLKSLKQLLPGVVSATGADRKFAAANLMLHNPGFNCFVNPGAQRQESLGEQNEFNDNWWDTMPNYDPAGVSANSFSKLPDFPNLLTAAQKTQASVESKRLTQMGAGSACLGEIVCSYAGAHPADSRVPEALAKVVWASHYGAKSTLTSKYSKQAFDLLHKKYPKSPFTARTPYHY